MPKIKKRKSEINSGFANRRLHLILKRAQDIPQFKGLRPALPWRASVNLATSRVMARLNREFMGKKTPTDVLSFEAPAIFRREGYLGDLVICLPVLKRQARMFGHPAKFELDVLMVHGVLHLLGFDHEKNKREALKMGRLEEELLQAVWARSQSPPLPSYALTMRSVSGK